MAKSSPAAGNDSPVARLLAERDQYSQWLSRLGVTDDAVPEAVRGKVRADYEARLVGVVEQLRQHSEQVNQDLAAHRAKLEDLIAKESSAQEKLAEAELRHAVGEYDEAQWQKLRGETHRILVTAREESGQIVEEISRLEEVVRLIAAPPSAAPATPAAPAAGMGTVAVPAVKRPAAPPRPEPVAEAADAEVEAEPLAPATAKGGKGSKAQRESARTLFFPSGKGAEKGVDELDFLKSVGGGEAPAGKKGGSTKPAAIKEAPPEPIAVPIPAPAVPTVDGPAHDTSSGSKTLKCAECGTMNRATEWYCERCGAELAAL